MRIYIGADHRGFALKESLKQKLEEGGVEVIDFGNTKYDKDDDYPDFAKAVAGKVSEDPKGSRGVLICGSGAGVDIVANKFPSVRSILGISEDQVQHARRNDDVNVLSLAADFTKVEAAEGMTKVFLETTFEGAERLTRRIQKIADIEENVR